MNKKGNIMLLVLFIMMVSSLLWLLISHYTNNLISVSRLFNDYYKAYYYAYGGLELWLAQTKNHGYWFEDALTFTTFSWCVVGTGCRFTMDISSRQYTISDDTTDVDDCAEALSEWTYYTLSEGEALIIPLFWDNTVGFSTPAYTIVADADLIAMTPALYTTWTALETYGIKILDEELENYNTSVEGEVGNPDPYSFASDISGYASSAVNKNYLIFTNASGDDKQYCLELNDADNPLPGKYTVITSVGYYGHAQVSLGANKTNQLPSYIIYGAID